MKPVKTQPRFQMESCGLCLHPYAEHFDVNGQPDFCCDGCREYMTHQEYAENPLFWCLNSYDQTTIVDGNNRVVDSRQVLKLLQSYTGERDALKAEVATANNRIEVLEDALEHYAADMFNCRCQYGDGHLGEGCRFDIYRGNNGGDIAQAALKALDESERIKESEK